MLEAAKSEGDECPYCSRIERCCICDRTWRTHEKWKFLTTWGRAPRTWINRAVILLSILNIVLAEYGLELEEERRGSVGESGHYSRQWAVSIEGGQEVADRIAAKHDFVNLGKIFGNFYHFEHKRLAKRSLEPHAEFHRNLVSEAEVKWARQQIVKKRSKRDLITLRPRTKSSYIRFNDVEWPTMWYLNRGQGLDMNVQGAWREGISGSGVVVTILDDGLEKTHPDLVANYDPQASYDVNNHDEDPMPRYDPIDSNRHGTRCAGEVAAVANNSLCSVGVAFGASVGGVRMLDGDVTDAVEARSLSLNPQHIDIYSASWGPDDDGKTVDGPGELATRAFIEGVTKGRQGKGSIFVWASGNGGREHDNCNCDGYTNSIWTLSISSATEKGLVPWYSEACSSTLATTYSSGAVNERQIVTTDLRHKCTNGHTGTSASAPLAAGICALALEANRDLTWRDMQHIVVRTARPANLKSSDWKVNGVGRNVSHSFGYGLMDATAMVRLARTWKTVPEQHRCEVSAPHVDKPIPPRSKVILILNVTECAGVNFLEHVQAKISLSSVQRGGLQIYLTSPAGTKATLLAKRPQDTSRNPFSAWPFMSVHTWGEMPFGVWQLEIHYEGHFMGRAILQEWSLLFYGTSEVPAEEEKLYRFFPSLKPVSRKPAVVGHSSPKSYKSILGSSGQSNRKTLKNWKGKQTSSRTGKIAGNGGSDPPRSSAATKSSKTGQKFLHLGKTKDVGPGRESSKTTWAPPSTHGLPLTIVLGPGGDFATLQKVPDVFQKYSKVEQLFPLYVNGSRPYKEESFITSKTNSGPANFSKSGPKSKSLTNGQKAERQNRFDTSSVPRTNAEGKPDENRKPSPSRKQQIQGHFEGWQMLFYGTETTPNEEGKDSGSHGGRGNGKEKKGPFEEAVQRPEPGLPRGEWAGAEPPGVSSSACASLSESAYHCIECVSGLYLHEGRCEAVCPPKTYPGVGPDQKATCMPCHYTCLTCAGESDGHCVSCHPGASPVASGFSEPLDFPPPPPPEPQEKRNGEATDPDEFGPRPSWGKRMLRAVRKKILDHVAAPRPLFYCYPARVMEKMEYSRLWYHRMTLFFGINLSLLLVLAVLFLCKRLVNNSKIKTNTEHDSRWRYFKMKTGNSDMENNVIYLSSSSDEENEEFLTTKENSRN